jgi:hypothetical protein
VHHCGKIKSAFNTLIAAKATGFYETCKMSVIVFQKLEGNTQLTDMEPHNCVVESSDH